MTLLRTHIFWRPNDVRHDCFARDNVYFLIMQPSRKRLHSGGWIKKNMAILRRFFPQSSIHTLGPYPTNPQPTFHHHIRNNSPFPSVSLTPIQPSDYPFEQTAYLRRFPHSCNASILCYLKPIMSLYCRKTPYFRSISFKNIEITFNFKQFHHTRAETSAF